MLSENEVLIDEFDMGFLQMLITAVNESRLTHEEKEQTRKTLDHWQRALTFLPKLRVTF